MDIFLCIKNVFHQQNNVTSTQKTSSYMNEYLKQTQYIIIYMVGKSYECHTTLKSTMAISMLSSNI